MLTQPLQWQDRKKSVAPMPGGYGGFLNSFRWVVECVSEKRLTEPDLRRKFAEQFRLSDGASSQRISFLRRSGLIRMNSSICVVGPSTREWMQSGDASAVIHQIHTTTRFLGEVLEAARVPLSAQELLHCANEQFRMGWTSMMQINNRRGWLQSAGLVVPIKEGKLALTQSGEVFLATCAIEPPLPERRAAQVADQSIEEPVQVADDGLEPETLLESGPRAANHSSAAVVLNPPGRDSSAREVQSLERRVRADSVDTNDPSKFEKTVCEAFAFLGFDAKHLGGSGQTDVMLVARYGIDAGYSVAVDAKTTASGKLRDQQVNWATLVEHRRQHDAGYSMVVGPAPSGTALMKFATTYEVAVLSAADLAELCRLHADRPLALGAYRPLFETSGKADLDAARGANREAVATVELASRLVEVMHELQGQLGALNVDSLQVAMLGRIQPALDKTTIQHMLDALASPLVGAVEGSPESGYVLACHPSITGDRLRMLAETFPLGGVGQTDEFD